MVQFADLVDVMHLRCDEMQNRIPNVKLYADEMQG